MKLYNQYMSGKETVFKTHQPTQRPIKVTFKKEDEEKYLNNPHTPKVKFNNDVVFLDAVMQLDADLVEKLILEGQDPNVTNVDGLTALHTCAIENSLKVAATLMNNGALANVKDNDWWTPMHAGAACGNWRIVDYIINNGGDLLAVNADGDLPLDICEGDKVLKVIEDAMVDKGYTEEIRQAARLSGEENLLNEIKRRLAAGESIDRPNKKGICLAHVAAGNGWLNALSLLFENKADLNVPDRDDGNTPLHLAVIFGQNKIIEKLGEAKVDPNIKNRHLEVPLVLTEEPAIIFLLKNFSSAVTTESDFKGIERDRRTSTIKRSNAADKEKLSEADKKKEGSELETTLDGVRVIPEQEEDEELTDEEKRMSALKSTKSIRMKAGDDTKLEEVKGKQHSNDGPNPAKSPGEIALERKERQKDKKGCCSVS